MDELQEKLLERLALLKRQIKEKYPELAERMKERPIVTNTKKKKDEQPHEKK